MLFFTAIIVPFFVDTHVSTLGDIIRSFFIFGWVKTKIFIYFLIVYII